MALSYRMYNADTQKVPHLGYPLKSGGVSAAFNQLFEALGINAVSLPREVEKGGLPALMEARKVFKIEKFSLTMPHKKDIIPLLDDVDEASRLFESVNQVTTIDGKLVGRGFDGVGTVLALQAGGATLKGANVMMIGAGSISGAIGYELAQSGAAALTILNRTVANAQGVADKLNANTSIKASAGGLSEKELDAAAEKADVLVQVSSQGMTGLADHPYLGFMARLPKSCTVMDGVMVPQETSFIKAARAEGFNPILGMEMSIQQLTAVMEFLFDVKVGLAEQKLAARVMCEMYGLSLPEQWQ